MYTNVVGLNRKKYEIKRDKEWTGPCRKRHFFFCATHWQKSVFISRSAYHSSV